LIEVFVRSREASHYVEFSVENVFTMTSVVNSIIYDQLDHDLFSFFTMERKVLSIA
jgi:hypothetical protein